MSGLAAAAEGLSQAEGQRLGRLERTIERAVEVTGRIAGEALATIRDERLYRLTHSSFEAYVLDRWGFSRATAYRMIDAATPRAAVGPPEREGPGQRVSGRDSPAPAAPAAETPARAANSAETLRCWAVVASTLGGSAVLHLEEGARPRDGQRVLVAWTTD